MSYFEQKVDDLIKQASTILAQARGRRGKHKMPKPPRRPTIKPVQMQYLKLLLPMIRKLKELRRQIVFPALPGMIQSAKSLRPDHMDVWVDDISELMAQLRTGLYRSYRAEDFVNIASKMAENIESKNFKYYQTMTAKLIGVGGARSELWLKPEMQGFIKSNVGYITGIAEDSMSRVEKTMMMSLQQGWTYEDTASELGNLDDIDENKAKLIARDQTSKFNASLDEHRQKEMGIVRYVWRTVEDERVRESHAECDGHTFSWDEDTSVDGEVQKPDGYNPGEDINCRCTAEAVFEGEETLE